MHTPWLWCHCMLGDCFDSSDDISVLYIYTPACVLTRHLICR